MPKVPHGHQALLQETSLTYLLQWNPFGQRSRLERHLHDTGIHNLAALAFFTETNNSGPVSSLCGVAHSDSVAVHVH
jgi:hypothetical protein